MSTIRELAEEHWQGRGELVHTHHPVQPVHVHHDDGTTETASEEIDDGLLTLKSIASVNALDTGDGLVMLDTGVHVEKLESIRYYAGFPMSAHHVISGVKAKLEKAA